MVPTFENVLFPKLSNTESLASGERGRKVHADEAGLYYMGP